MPNLIYLILAIFLVSLPASNSGAAPLCGERQVPCWNDHKIDEARAILVRRGHPVDRDFIISIEMNRGQFPNALALADWIQWGSCDPRLCAIVMGN